MNARGWSFRILTLLQLVLLSPPMVGGSICIAMDGSEASELGFCACTVALVGAAEEAIGTPGTADCGPCRDESFRAMRARPPASGVHGLASAAVRLAAITSGPPIAGAGSPRAGDPSGRRLSILRC